MIAASEKGWIRCSYSTRGCTALILRDREGLDLRRPLCEIHIKGLVDEEREARMARRRARQMGVPVGAGR
jgi:hypothetical protein